MSSRLAHSALPKGLKSSSVSVRQAPAYSARRAASQPQLEASKHWLFRAYSRWHLLYILYYCDISSSGEP